MSDTAELKTSNTEMQSALPPEETERLTREIVAALKTVFDPETEQHWDYGYASTVHASQGRTADRTIYHADSQQLATNKEGWYVAVSRARDDLRVVTDDVAALKEAVGESRTQASALEAVERHRLEDRHAVHPEVREGGSERTGPSRQLEIER